MALTLCWRHAARRFRRGQYKYVGFEEFKKVTGLDLNQQECVWQCAGEEEGAGGVGLDVMVVASQV